MKLSNLLLVVLLFACSIKLIHAQIIIVPGENKILTNNPATGGEAGDNGWANFNLDSDFNLSTKTIKAQANSYPLITVGKGEAYALLFYDFQITSTPQTQNNVIGGFINYSVFWKGFQEIFAPLLSNAIVNVELNIKDQTANELVKKIDIHDLDIKTVSYKLVLAGFDFDDSDTEVNTLPVLLKRGHQYRIHLKLTTTLIMTGINQPLSSCDYMDGIGGLGDGRVELKHLTVKLGLDDEETLQKLAQLDSLENRIDSLEYKLEHHYHTYLTGRGIGHNNTEASTTLSIFEEVINPGGDPSIYYESQENYIPDENTENNSMPNKFSIKQNYPNPFNPSTKIVFAIPTQELVTIKIFDVLGQQVKLLMNEVKNPGNYVVNFDAGKFPSGTYIYEIRAGDFVETKKMVLMK